MKSASTPYYAESLQPYYGLIDSALSARNAASGDYDTDAEHRVPVFVSRMCATLAATCADRAGASVPVGDVLRVESMASGHSDYHRKLALYCRELEQRFSAH
jgi:hypothetical protein